MTRKPNRYRKIGQATLLGSCLGAGPAGFAAWQLGGQVDKGVFDQRGIYGVKNTIHISYHIISNHIKSYCIRSYHVLLNILLYHITLGQYNILYYIILYCALSKYHVIWYYLTFYFIILFFIK